MNAVRASDCVGRNGGEEFIVLLPDTATDSSVLVAQRIRKAMAAISVHGVEREITVSIGMATIPDHAEEADRLIRSADRALYVANGNGRNRIEIAEPLRSAVTVTSESTGATGAIACPRRSEPPRAPGAVGK